MLPAEQARRRALTPGERAALALLAEGLGTAEVAARLGIAASTVNNRIRAAWQRLGLRSRAEAVAAWREMGRGSA